MECYKSTVQLPQAVGEVEAISWSQDQRIAVTSSDTVYIFTLKRRELSSSSLPVSITTACGLPCTQNPHLTSSTSLYNPAHDTQDFSVYLDPTLVPNHTPSAHRESGWSPAGCDIIGGCLLSVLTVGGKLWLFTPPGSHTMKWHISTCLNGHNKARYMTFHWYPHILPAKIGVGGVSFIALATRSRIEVVAVTVPVHRNKEPERQVVWQGEVEGNGWPCRLRWSHTHFSNGKVHLAVGSNAGKLVVLSWTLPTEWSGGRWVEPDHQVVWAEEDGMAVRHIAWQLDPSSDQQPWLVFAKSSTLIAVQLPSAPSDNCPTHTTIFGVHSRSVSGLTSLHGNQYISCSLDGSVSKFMLSKSCESHVTPTAVEVGSASVEVMMQGLAVSDNDLFAAFLTSECTASVRQKIHSHLHLTPLLPLSLLDLNSAEVSWDVSEAIRMHSVSKQPLPGNIPLLSNRQMWHNLSPTLQLCLYSQSPPREGEEEEEEEVRNMVLMEHVLEVLGDCEVKGDADEGEDAKMSLKVMCQWVESSQLAPPPQLAVARMILGRLNGLEIETCHVCQSAIPLTNPRKETCINGHSWERCCLTLLLATSSLCGCCRGCGAVSHNSLSLQTSSNGSWFTQLLSKGRCTFCHSYFDLVI